MEGDGGEGSHDGDGHPPVKDEHDVFETGESQTGNHGVHYSVHDFVELYPVIGKFFHNREFHPLFAEGRHNEGVKEGEEKGDACKEIFHRGDQHLEENNWDNTEKSQEKYFDNKFFRFRFV